MSLVRIILLAGAATVLLAAPCELAAERGRRDAQREIEITERVIRKVRRLVQESENSRAEQAFKRALDVQRKAMHEFRGMSYMMSTRLTRVARNYAMRAAKLAGEPAENKEFVLRQLQRTSEMLRRIREQIRQAGDRGAQDLFRAALDRQQEAESSFREQRFRVALRLTQLARDLGQKALGRARGGGEAEAEKVRRAVERTDEVLRRIGEQPRLPELLKEAQRMQREAQRAYGDGRYGWALKLTLKARDMAQEASGDEGLGDVSAKFARAEALLRRAEAAALKAGSDHAVRLVKEGREHLRKARVHLERGESLEALAQLKLATRKAEKALKLAGEA